MNTSEDGSHNDDMRGNVVQGENPVFRITKKYVPLNS